MRKLTRLTAPISAFALVAGLSLAAAPPTAQAELQTGATQT